MKKLFLVMAVIMVISMVVTGCGKNTEECNICSEYSYPVTIQDGTDWTRYEYHCDTSKDFARRTAERWNWIELEKGHIVTGIWETTDDEGNIYYFFDVAG